MSTEFATEELLELSREAGGLRHYLAVAPIHAGELLELLCDDGSWALGRCGFAADFPNLPTFRFVQAG